MSNLKKIFMHPFHIVTFSPWPLLASMQLFNILFITVKKFFSMHVSGQSLLVNMIILIFISIFWWRDVMRESTFESLHSKEVMKGLKIGMILFITSEIFFFISFFWGYFHSSLSPDIFIGQSWPCKGISAFNPLEIPLVNTIILLSSGVTLTASHHYLMIGKVKKSFNFLLMTIMLGMYFTLLQYIEYMEASFSIADSIYGSTFFMSTGFHGIHVLIGTMFLFVCLMRMKNNQFTSNHHIGFEASAWYWHFVDVVWLYLYLFIYWFGN